MFAVKVGYVPKPAFRYRAAADDTMKSSLATTWPSFTVTGPRTCLYQSW
jgi:hypothetical protein